MSLGWNECVTETVCVCVPCGLGDRCRISPPHFLAECHKKRLNQGSFVLLCFFVIWFLADRTNGRAYGTVLRLSSSVCNVMYCG